MKKFYFLLVAIMVAFSAKAYDYYLNGAFINWKGWTVDALANYKLTQTGGSTYVLDLTKTSTPDISGKFVIAAFNGTSVDWSAKIGTKSGKVKEGVAYSYAVGGGDLEIDGTIKNAKLELNTAAQTLTITGQAEANSFTVVYMVGDFGTGTGWDESLTKYPLNPVAGATDTYSGTFTFEGEAGSIFYTKPKCGVQVLGPEGDDLEPENNVAYTLVSTSDKAVVITPGTYTFTVVVDQEANSCEFTVTQDAGVNEIVVDSNVPATYYNLQGVQVANPVAGQLYIRKAGNKATKVIF